VPPKRPDVQHAATVIDAAMRQGEIPGAVLKVRAGGTVMHEQAFGRRQFDRDVLLQRDDVSPRRPSRSRSSRPAFFSSVKPERWDSTIYSLGTSRSFVIPGSCSSTVCGMARW
jgi:hypothetical protein